RLLDAVPLGEAAWCGFGELGKDNNDPQNNPASAVNWGQERSIRAELIRWLCEDKEAAKHVHSKGICIGGAKIEGELDLSYVVLHGEFILSSCFVPYGLNLYSAEARRLDLSATWTGPVNLSELVVGGYVNLSSFSWNLGPFGWGFRAAGQVNLVAA